MPASAFLTRVTLKNYKSIAACNVELGPLMFLVGRNGAGKSNFLDALRFISDALNISLDQAIRQRNGIKEVRRRSGGHPTHFSMRLEFRLPTGDTGHYAFRIGATPQGGFEVQTEECRLRSNIINAGLFQNQFPAEPNVPQPPRAAEESYFLVKGGKVESSEPGMPVALTDRLYLVNASSTPKFRPVYDALSHMAFYNLNPAEIREPQTPDAGDRLTRDGNNLASVLRRMSDSSANVKIRIEQYLATVVPGLEGVDAREIGPYETLQFRQEVSGAKNSWRFPASSMSDGTLRALGVLIALFQADVGNGTRVPLIGIEEPETALHPAAVGALLDALREASRHKQVLITSHSDDLLDDKHIEADALLSVVATKGVTQIAPIDEASRSLLRDHLSTAGELLRQDQIAPDPKALEEMNKSQLRFFGENAA